MPDNASTEAATAAAGGSEDAPRSPAALRRVPPATAEERLTREEGMARALKVGAKPYRDADGKGRHIAFKEANLAPVEPWVRDPRAKRGYRRTQELRKAAGQLIGEPGDRIEIAKRLGVLHWEQGSDIEGAAARGLKDAIWSREHVYGPFTVPRHDGRMPIETGRVAALAEEAARKIQAEDPKARGGFWVRDRTDLGLLYVVPNAEPEAEQAGDEIIGGEGEVVLVGQASPPPAPPPRKPSAPPQTTASPTQPLQASGIPPRVGKLPADANGLFLLYRQRLAFFEGGLANRPAHEDEGGLTNKGVSQILLDALHKNKSYKYRHYPRTTDLLSDDQIETILRKEIFDPLHIWEVAQIPNLLRLAPELPEQIFDMGVQHGVGIAGLVAQESLDKVMGTDLRVIKNGVLKHDGVIGPVTRAVIAQAVAAGKLAELNNLISDKRAAILRSRPTAAFNPGWATRADSFRISPTGPTQTP